MTKVVNKTKTNGTARKRTSFGKTYYWVDTTKERPEKGPNQLRGLIKWMIDNEITSPEKAERGAIIGEKAVEDGHVVTNKLTGPVIFAYYARRMEKEYGLVLERCVHARSQKEMM